MNSVLRPKQPSGLPKDDGLKDYWLKDRLKVWVLVIVALGIFFRFANLDRQVYWHDETYTSLRISGYSALEVNQAVFNGKVITPEALQKYQVPNSDRTLADTVRSLAIDDSQHPPLYYVMVRLWAQWVGSSISAIRSLTAWISVLVFPSVYWLCRELFWFSGQSTAIARPIFSLTTALAIALMAISPFHVLYAQEAREYALWSVLLLLSSGALLRAIRLDQLWDWGLFTVLLTLSLYTQPVTLLVAIAYGLYLLGSNRFRLGPKQMRGFLSIGLGIAAFYPWLNIIAQNWSKTGANWTSVPLPLPILLKTWGLHLARMFVLPEGDFGFDTNLVYVSLPLILGLVSLAFYKLYRQTPVRVWLMILILTGSSFVPLALMDLIQGGQRSTVSRYIVPLYLGVLVAIAYLLATQLLTTRPLQRKLWQGITAIILSVSLFFCTINAQAETSWPKGINHNLPSVANILNAAPQPLLVSNSFGINFGSIFALSHRLKPNTKLQLVDGWFTQDFQNVPQLATGFSDIFLLNPTDQFRQKLEQKQGKKTELVFHDYHLFLWKFGE